jgi:hypothetical protein
MDHFPLVTNSYHYVKLIQCGFRLLPVFVEMGIASLYLACLRSLESEVGVGLVWRGGPLRPKAGGELPDFRTVAFILDFRQSHMTVQHTGQLLTCLA